MKAHHDVNVKGMSLEIKEKLVNYLKKYGRIFITSEGELEKEFLKYEVQLSPEKIHDLMYFAHMFISDSQTMTIEAVVLGTTAIRCNDFVGRCPVIEELEHNYNMTFGFRPGNEDKMILKIKDLLNNKNLKREWNQKRETLLKDKINLTEWMINYFENI